MRTHKLSAVGRYYVLIDDCDICAMCEVTAPGNFKIDEENCYNGAFVFKQPESMDEEEQCRLAVTSCPTAAIHDDGDVKT